MKEQQLQWVSGFSTMGVWFFYENIGAWANKAETLDRMDKQFIKHVQEKFVRPLEQGGLGRQWPQGKKPRLHYVNTGNFFTEANQTSASHIFDRFKKIVEKSDAPGFDDLRSALGHGTSNFEANLRDVLKITDDLMVIPPFAS